RSVTGVQTCALPTCDSQPAAESTTRTRMQADGPLVGLGVVLRLGVGEDNSEPAQRSIGLHPCPRRRFRRWLRIAVDRVEEDGAFVRTDKGTGGFHRDSGLLVDSVQDLDVPLVELALIGEDAYVKEIVVA